MNYWPYGQSRKYRASTSSLNPGRRAERRRASARIILRSWHSECKTSVRVRMINRETFGTWHAQLTCTVRGSVNSRRSLFPRSAGRCKMEHVFQPLAVISPAIHHSAAISLGSLDSMGCRERRIRIYDDSRGWFARRYRGISRSSRSSLGRAFRKNVLRMNYYSFFFFL